MRPRLTETDRPKLITPLLIALVKDEFRDIPFIRGFSRENYNIPRWICNKSTINAISYKTYRRHSPARCNAKVNAGFFRARRINGECMRVTRTSARRK